MIFTSNHQNYSVLIIVSLSYNPGQELLPRVRPITRPFPTDRYRTSILPKHCFRVSASFNFNSVLTSAGMSGSVDEIFRNFLFVTRLLDAQRYEKKERQKKPIITAGKEQAPPGEHG
jgi:hypothetical protein